MLIMAVKKQINFLVLSFTHTLYLKENAFTAEKRDINF